MRTALILLVSGVLLAGATAVQLGACGNAIGSKAAGESCFASSECGADLVCDFSKTPSTCAGMGKLPADASFDAGRVIPMIDAKPNAPDARPPDARPPDATVDAMPDAMPDA